MPARNAGAITGNRPEESGGQELRDAIAIAAANVAVDPVKAHSGPQGREHQKDDPENRERITQREAELDQTISRQTESLARMFRNIEINHKEFQTAKGLRVAANARLESPEGLLREGRITIDRLSGCGQSGRHAVGTEALYMATYNTAIVFSRRPRGRCWPMTGSWSPSGPNQGKKYVAAEQGKTDTAAKPAAFAAEPKNAPAPPVNTRGDQLSTHSRLGNRVLRIEATQQLRPRRGAGRSR